MIFIREVDDENLETINNVITLSCFLNGGYFFPHFLIDVIYFHLKEKENSGNQNNCGIFVSFKRSYILNQGCIGLPKTTLFHFFLLFLDKYANICKGSFQFGRCVYQIYRLVNGNLKKICEKRLRICFVFRPLWM